jgi:hypothetical protein
MNRTGSYSTISIVHGMPDLTGAPATEEGGVHASGEVARIPEEVVKGKAS